MKKAYMKNMSCSFAAVAILLTSAALQKPKFTQGTLVVVNKSGASATLISLDTGEVVASVKTGNGPHEVAVSPDGKTAVVCNYGEKPESTLTVIDLEEKRPIKTISLGEYKAPHGIEFLPDGERVIATVERSKAVVVVNIKAGKVEKAIETGDLSCHMIATTPDGHLGFAASIGSDAVSVLDMKKGIQIKTIKTDAGAEGIASTPNGKEVWVTNREGNTVSVIDVKTLEVTKTIPSESFPIRIKFTPDGKYALVSNARSGDVAVFDTKTKKEIRRISMEVKAKEDIKGRTFKEFGASPTPVGILVTPDGSHAFIANTMADVVTVIDLNSWEIKYRLTAGKEPDGMAYSKIKLK